ncbi:MAG: 5-(carboxyamino)imidazole ribonucleotide synthase [Prochloron sp. SP5CPC1]|nr:5-(carboxyamino)imidazole ribonucleotide synthase [Candidatus Paraprochloron terpiosi SP5CPC1]
MSVKRVGVIGGGQLALMMAGAAKALGIELVVQTPNDSDPAVKVAADTILAPIEDSVATAELGKSCDVITFENEFIDLAALSSLESQGVCFRPSLSALSPLLDKYSQRCYLRDMGLPVPQFVALSEEEKISSPFGESVVLKACRHGYDGQGTFILHSLEALAKTCQRCQGQAMVLEEYIPFQKELAIIASRSVTGEVAIYPVVETQQEKQVCRRVIAPASISVSIKEQVEAIASTLLNQLGYVGVLGIELFLTPDNKVLVNEIAPRTHNSGHYTLDACSTSQFEMHLRAVAGLPLGDPGLKCPGAVMVNLLGYEHSREDYREVREQIGALERTYVHWYGKTSRPGRKLGHVTILAGESESRSHLLAKGFQIESIFTAGNC